jgi:cell division GTPase FtsZ
VHEIAQLIQRQINCDANFVMGMTINAEMEDSIKVMIIATGLAVDCVFQQEALTKPAFFRPSKKDVSPRPKLIKTGSDATL